jgi:outer membrane lipoprotein SlyB
VQTTCKPSLGWHSQAAIGAGVGGLAGAAGGAIVGAFLGNPGIGAAVGAAAGGFGGAAKQGFSAEDKFKGAYSNCMSGRGHNVLRS